MVNGGGSVLKIEVLEIDDNNLEEIGIFFFFFFCFL